MAEIVIHAGQVEMIPLDALKGYVANARTHPESQIETLAKVIQDSGFTSPLLIDDDDTIIAGHGRWAAARKLNMSAVPCVRVSGLSTEQIRGLRLSDNQVGLLSGYDEAILKLELGDLQTLGFDLSLTGFSSADLSSLFSEPEGLTDPDDAPEAPENPVAVLGDVWALGEHRIMCGNSLDMADVQTLLAGTTPDLANCDPPYGLSAVKGRKVGGGNAPFGGWKDGDRTKGAKQAGGGGAIPPGNYDAIIGDETTDTAVAAYGVLIELGVPVIVLWGGNYYADQLPPSRCWLVWDKETNGNFADAELAWTNQDKVVRLLRHQWNGLMKASERGQRRVHPTQKPVALAEWVADTIAPKAKTVLDLFLGSGSVLIAAQNRGLACFGMEMSPAYIDVAIARWEGFTGKKATHAETGETFEQVRARRASEQPSEEVV